MQSRSRPSSWGLDNTTIPSLTMPNTKRFNTAPNLCANIAPAVANRYMLISCFSRSLTHRPPHLALVRTRRRRPKIADVLTRITHDDTPLHLRIDDKHAVLAVLLTVPVLLVHAISHHQPLGIFIGKVAQAHGAFSEVRIDVENVAAVLLHRFALALAKDVVPHSARWIMALAEGDGDAERAHGVWFV